MVSSTLAYVLWGVGSLAGIAALTVVLTSRQPQMAIGNLSGVIGFAISLVSPVSLCLGMFLGLSGAGWTTWFIATLIGGILCGIGALGGAERPGRRIAVGGLIISVSLFALVAGVWLIFLNSLAQMN